MTTDRPRQAFICTSPHDELVAWFDLWCDVTIKFSRFTWLVGGALSGYITPFHGTLRTLVLAFLVLGGLAAGSLIYTRTGDVRGLTHFFATNVLLAPLGFGMVRSAVRAAHTTSASNE